MLLKQSTAKNLTVLMVDSTDHITGKTGLTLTITASKDGGTFASITPTVTELATGWYKLALTTSHTDTLGDLALHITGTGADPTDVQHQVVTLLPGEAVLVQNGTSTGQIDLTSGQVKVQSGTGSGQLSVTSGVIDSNVTKWSGTTVASPDTAGYPKVTHKVGTGTGELSITSGAVTVGTNNDKTGYRLSYEIRSNTAQAGAAGTITLDASASATDNFYNGTLIYLNGGTGAGQARLITAYVGSTKVATVSPNWTTTPDNTSTFIILPKGNDIVTTILDKTGYALSSAGVDDIHDEVVEGAYTLRQLIRLYNSILLAKSSGFGPSGASPATWRDIGDTKDRVTGTVDSNGNRTAVTIADAT